MNETPPFDYLWAVVPIFIVFANLMNGWVPYPRLGRATRTDHPYRFWTVNSVLLLTSALNLSLLLSHDLTSGS